MDVDDGKTLITSTGNAGQTFKSKHTCPECGLEVPITVTKCPQDGTDLSDTLGEGRKIVGNYEFLEFIGSGGMGVIYKARHPVLKRLVAVKMLHSHLMNDAIVTRFQHEAQAVSGLSHANIIAVHDFGLSGHGQPYMVMDFLEGKPLSEVLKQGPLRLEAVLNIAIQIAEGLQHAHERGVLHRDLKPSNIMVTDADCAFPEAKIVDFGIAKIMETESTRVTQTGELLGTPQYMSPEQCRGGELDARSDVYALGCVMFEAITGKPPFSGESMVAVIVDQISKPPRTLSEVRPDMSFPLEVEELMAKALAKDPADRFQSMNALLEEAIRVQRLVAQAEKIRHSSWRFLRFNRDQRQIMLLCIAAGFSLLGVLSSVLLFVKTVQTDVINKAKGSPDTQSDAKPPSPQLRDRVQIERNKERFSMIKYVDPSKLDYDFADRFFRDDFELERLDAKDSKIDDRSLALISNQRNLKLLNLQGTQITDAGVPYLRLLRHLYDLNLSYTKISDEGLKLVGQIPNLAFISLNGDKVTDKGISYLQNRKLRSILLCDTGVGDEGAKILSQIPTINALQMRSCKGVTNVGAVNISNLSRMEFLSLENTSITDQGATALSKLTELKELDIGSNKITAGSIRALCRLPNVVRLGLTSTNVTPDWVPYFGKFKSLINLGIPWSPIDDAGLATLASTAPRIEILELRGCGNITDAGLSSIRTMKKLHEVDLRETHISNRAVEALRKARPDLSVKDK